MDNQNVLIQHPQVAMTVVDGQAVIVLSDSGQVTVLNEIGTRVWELCDGKHTVGEIVSAILSEYDVDAESARQDVLTFLQRLKDLEAVIIN